MLNPPLYSSHRPPIEKQFSNEEQSNSHLDFHSHIRHLSQRERSQYQDSYQSQIEIIDSSYQDCSEKIIDIQSQQSSPIQDPAPKFLRATLQTTQEHMVIFKQKTLQVFKNENNASDLCPCCLKCTVSLIQEGEKYSLMANVKDFQTLGISFPIYFILVKYLIFLLLFVLIGGVICMGLNSDKTGQQNDDQSLFKEINPGYLQNNSLIAQQIIHLFQILGLIFLFEFYFNKSIKKHCVEMVVDIKKVADYTVMVTNLPQQYWIHTSKEHRGVWNYMQKALNRNGCVGLNTQIDQFSECSDIKDLIDLNQEIQRLQGLKHLLDLNILQNNLQTQISQRKWFCFKKTLPPLAVVDYQLKKLKDDRGELVNTLRGGHRKLVAFVSYRSIVHAKEILEQFQKPRFKRLCSSEEDHIFQGKKIQVKQAPNPTDVFWRNLTVSKSSKNWRRLIIFALSTVILVIAGFFVGALATINKDLDQSEKIKDDVNTVQTQSASVSILISILILIFNLILEVIMDMITHIELHNTWTNHKVSVSRKLVALMFLNTAVIPTIVKTQYMVEGGQKDPDEDWFTSQGLVNDAYAILVINALAPPFFYFYWFNILYWANRFFAWISKRKLKNPNQIYSQNQINRDCAVFEMDLAERYAQSLKTFSVALFFAPIVPLGLLISAGGLILEYWIAKYMLLRVLSKPREYNELLGIQMTIWVRFGILSYACGVFYFYYFLITEGNHQREQEFTVLILVGILIIGYSISSFFQILPDSIHKQVKDTLELKIQCKQRENIPYYEFKNEVETDYRKENPLLADYEGVVKQTTSLQRKATFVPTIALEKENTRKNQFNKEW